MVWILSLLLFCQTTLASVPCCVRKIPPRYSALLYVGSITQNTLGQVIGMSYSLDNEKLYSIELSRYFSNCSAARIYFGQLFSQLALNINLTYHDDPLAGSIYEFDPYIYGAWHLFTLHEAVSLSIAVGEGLSYLTDIPTREKRNSEDEKKLLNYLMFEIVLSSPCVPKFELIGRIHHRSGVFGLYNANNSGSTAVGLALRYFFL